MKISARKEHSKRKRVNWGGKKGQTPESISRREEGAAVFPGRCSANIDGKARKKSPIVKRPEEGGKREKIQLFVLQPPKKPARSWPM